MRAPTQATVALIASLCGLGLAGVAIVRPALYHAAVASTDDGATRTDVARLERQVEVLTATVTRLRAAAPTPTTVAVAVAPTADADADADIDVDGPSTAPSYRAFEAPLGVTVHADHGALAVHNTNPALAGQVVTITGERDDGVRERLVVMVPDVDP